MSLPSLTQSGESPSQQGQGSPPLTIFAIPKPFVGRIDLIQRNALGSWVALRPEVDVVLFGDEKGVADVASEFGVHHIPEVARNAMGTPLVSDAFRRIAQWSQSPYLAYCNADLILLRDFCAAIERLTRLEIGKFLAIGRRINIDVERRIDFGLLDEVQSIVEAARAGRAESVMCKDYFVFPRGEFDCIPPFAVGRGNWDSWMVHTAKARGVPVVDLSACVTVLHQTHEHDHVAGGRAASYVFGPEARQNEVAGGGKYWIRGATADWELTPYTLQRKPWSRVHLPFWLDLPNACRLVWSLLRRSASDKTRPTEKAV